MGQVRAGLVRQIFPGPGDGHLDEHGGNGGDDGHHQDADNAAAFVVVPHAAENGAEAGNTRQDHDSPGHGRGNGGDEDVPVAHMAQLMGQNPLQLSGGEQAHDALGGRHRGMLRVAARGKGVGRVIRNDVDPGFGDTGLES